MYSWHLQPVTYDGLGLVLKLVVHFLAELTVLPTNIFYYALPEKPVSSTTIRKIVFIIRKIVFTISKKIFPLISESFCYKLCNAC